MNEENAAVPEPASVHVVIRVGRTGWVSKRATLHYQSDRLVKAEGIELDRAGPLGLSGTLYVVKDLICRDNRHVMRVERQKIVNGKIVDTKNWGEIEEVLPHAA